MKLELAAFSSLVNGFFVKLVKFKIRVNNQSNRLDALLVKTARKDRCFFHQ